jgi:hypothetical protein
MNHYNSEENISMIIFEMYNDHISDEETYDCQKFRELCCWDCTLIESVVYEVIKN